MLKVYTAKDKKDINTFINSFMDSANGWAVSQPDCGNVDFPAQFVIVAEHRFSLATIHFLN